MSVWSSPSESDDFVSKSDRLREYEASKHDLNVNAEMERWAEEERLAEEEPLAEEERLAEESAKNSTSR